MALDLLLSFIGLILGIFLADACAATPSRAMDVPFAAREAGYLTHTFETRSFSTQNVDQTVSYARGYEWYNQNFVMSPQNPKNNAIAHDGSISISSPHSIGLSTAAKITRAPGYVGTAFGGGGYFEAEISFDSRKVNLAEGTWPAFWAVSIESAASLPGQHWMGQPADYNHTVEFDIFEYLYNNPSMYGATTHDWSGIYGKTCPPRRCRVSSRNNQRVVPVGTDWRQWHKVGMRWIPARQDSPGKVTFYFDGKIIGPEVSWSEFSDQPPPVTAASPWAFGVVDQQHLMLLLSSGTSAPLRVRRVDVWQKSNKDNLVN